MKIINITLEKGIGNNPFEEMIFYKNIQWPNRCPCCGNIPENNEFVQLEHKVQIGMDTIRNKETVSYLVWNIPSCKRCKTHYKIDSVLFALLAIIPIILWIISGILIFIAGYAYDTLAIILWMIGFALMGIISYIIIKILRRIMKITIMRESCCDYTLPITVSSRYPILSMQIKNDQFADEIINNNR